MVWCGNGRERGRCEWAFGGGWTCVCVSAWEGTLCYSCLSRHKPRVTFPDLLTYIEAGYAKNNNNSQQCCKKRAQNVKPGKFYCFVFFFFVNGNNVYHFTCGSSSPHHKFFWSVLTSANSFSQVLITVHYTRMSWTFTWWLAWEAQLK